MTIRSYLQVVGSGIVQAPELQSAGPSHPGPSLVLQLAPSAAGARHEPVAAVLEANLQSAPPLHVYGVPLTTPQVAPAAASATATHVEVVGSHTRPVVLSQVGSLELHAAPSSTGTAHEPLLQASGNWQCESVLQLEPWGTSGRQIWSPMQSRPGAQSALAQLSPDFAVVAQTPQ
jgi:hypothetical protein